MDKEKEDDKNDVDDHDDYEENSDGIVMPASQAKQLQEQMWCRCNADAIQTMMVLFHRENHHGRAKVCRIHPKSGESCALPKHKGIRARSLPIALRTFVCLIQQLLKRCWSVPPSHPQAVRGHLQTSANSSTLSPNPCIQTSKPMPRSAANGQ